MWSSKLIEENERGSFQQESRGRREGKKSPLLRTSVPASLRNSIGPYIVCNGLQSHESGRVLVMQVGKATPAVHRYAEARVLEGPARCRVDAETLMVPSS